MSSFTPPNPYFNGIDFNKAFFSLQSSFVTLTYATKTYLNKITGGIISGLVSIIYSSSTPQLLIQNTNASGATSINLNNSTSTRAFNIGIGNTSSIAYANQAFIEAGASTNLSLNAGGYSATQAMLIDTSGNVGIGTGTMTQKLTLNNGALQIIGTSTNPGSTTTASIWNQSGVGSTISGNNIAFNINGSTEAMRISSTGNVGVGTNANFINLFEVNGGITSLSAFSYFGGTAGTVASATGLRIGKNDIFVGSGNGGNLTIWSSVYTSPIIIGYFGGNNVMTILNTSATISQPLTLNQQLIVNGSVGINTTSTNSSYTLFVNGNIGTVGNVYAGTYTMTSGNFQVLGTDGGVWNITYGTSYNSVNYSLLFNHIGYANYYISGTNTTNSQITSDERIKTDIKNIDNSLELISKLEPKNFNLLDDKDKVNLYGFIAQDVEQILPQLVRTEPNYIPNVYEYAIYDNNTKIININKDISSLLKSGDNLKIIIDNDEEDEIAISNNSKWYNRYKKRYVKVKDVIDSNNFTIDEELNITEQIFVYGIYADDFKTLDYNSLFSINTQAIKDLYKIIQTQQEQINQLLKI
jgi:hypothetical protein